MNRLSKVSGHRIGKSPEQRLKMFKDFLQSRIGQSSMSSWFNNIEVDDSSSEHKLLVPSDFIRDWVLNHYSTVLSDAFRLIYETKSFEVEASSSSKPSFSAPSPKKKSVSKLSDLSLPLDPNMRFDNFVVGKSNEIAFEASKRVAESMTVFNPLFVYGNSGFGKTHLLEAIGWRASELERNVCYISAEQYMLNFIKAIKSHTTIEFKNSFREVDILMIDDFQFMGGKDSTQEEFFHTFVYLISQKKQLVVSADKPPSELGGIEDRLRSRLGGGLVVNIHPPTYELRVGILEQKLKQNGKNIDGEIVKMIAENVRTNVRELEGALMRVCAQIEFFGHRMTVESARAILTDMFSKTDREITDKCIIETVASFYQLDYQEMFSQSRLKKIVRARQIAMFLCREINKRSLPEIGRLFGGKDHTTALYGIKKIDAEITNKQPVKEEMETIRQQLNNN